SWRTLGATVRAGRDDSMVEQRAAGLQQAGNSLEIDGQIVYPHMLIHADGDDLVEQTGTGNLPVILQPDFHPILELFLPHQQTRVLRLGAAVGDTDTGDAVQTRSTGKQAAPPAANVEHMIARTKPQLPADMV